MTVGEGGDTNGRSGRRERGRVKKRNSFHDNAFVQNFCFVFFWRSSWYVLIFCLVFSLVGWDIYCAGLLIALPS